MPSSVSFVRRNQVEEISETMTVGNTMRAQVSPQHTLRRRLKKAYQSPNKKVLISCKRSSSYTLPTIIEENEFGQNHENSSYFQFMGNSFESCNTLSPVSRSRRSLLSGLSMLASEQNNDVENTNLSLSTGFKTKLEKRMVSVFTAYEEESLYSLSKGANLPQSSSDSELWGLCIEDEE